MAGNKGRLNQLILNIFFEASIDNFTNAKAGLNRNIQLLSHGTRFLQISYIGEVLARILFYSINHAQAFPRRSQLDFYTFIGNLGGTQNLHSSFNNYFFGQVHHITIISKGLINFYTGELRVMSIIDALVAEYATKLINTIHTAHNQTLQVQLRRNTHINLHIQGIVIADEGTSSSATSNSVQNRSFNL